MDVAGRSTSAAERSGRLIEALVPAIRKTALLVQEASTSTREQASGIDTVSRAMASLDLVTQRNAAAAEELSSTAEELAAQAEGLSTAIGWFKLKGAQEPAKVRDLRVTSRGEAARTPAGRSAA